MSTRRPMVRLRALADGSDEARIFEIVAMLETQVLATDKRLLEVLDDPDGSDVDLMMWRSRRRTLIEVWEFCTNRVWRLPHADM